MISSDEYRAAGGGGDAGGVSDGELRLYWRRKLLRLSYCRGEADNTYDSHRKAESAAHSQVLRWCWIVLNYAEQINNELRAVAHPILLRGYP